MKTEETFSLGRWAVTFYRPRPTADELRYYLERAEGGGLLNAAQALHLLTEIDALTKERDALREAEEKFSRPPYGRFPPSFMPSEVGLYGGSPLAATMGRAEIEQAAAMIVHTCQAMGDKWQSVTAEDVRRVFADEIMKEQRPFCDWMRNPFFRPDFFALCVRGFGRLTDEETRAIELTETGIERLSRWHVTHERPRENK